MKAFFRRLWYVFRPTSIEFVKMPITTPSEEAYDLRGPPHQLFLDENGGRTAQSDTQLGNSMMYARFVLIVRRAHPGISEAAAAELAANVWYGQEDLEE